MIIELNNLTKMYDENNGVKDFNLHVSRGEFITLLGPSGCGKTTTLNLVSGFLSADSGQIIMDGKDISNLPPEDRKVSTVFQNYALFPHMTVIENVSYGIRYFKKLSKKKAIVAAQEYVDLVGLTGYENQNPGNLSGGQQQRVALARSIATGAEILLLDEPLSNLDVALRTHLRKELKDIQQKTDTTMIYVTHDQEEGLSLSDRIVVMDKGQIIQVGTPKEIYYNPANHYVADFVGNSNFMMDEQGNQYIVRPEDINLEHDPEGYYVISEAMFLGNRTEYVLESQQEKIEVHLQGIRAKDYHVGDRVKLEMLFTSNV